MNARSWLSGQSFCGRESPKTVRRYRFVCSCAKCGGLDSGEQPRGASFVSDNDSWRNATAINCPNGGRWELAFVESVSAERAAQEEEKIFGRIISKCAGAFGYVVTDAGRNELALSAGKKAS